MDMRGYYEFLAGLKQSNREQAGAVLDQYVAEILEELPRHFPDLGNDARRMLSTLEQDIKAGLIDKHFNITSEPEIEALTSEAKDFLMLLRDMISRGRL